MTTLDELFGPGRLQEEIDAGNVRVGRSGDGLSIFNYTEKASFSHAWSPVTLRCRGLIARDDTGKILAWPFPKFFNHSEHGHGNPWAPDLPDEPFRIYEKVDGSLGIVFWDPRQERFRVATRGSFNSEQAQWAQRWIDRDDDYLHPFTLRLHPGNTYLAEIVYPENRIVVNHGNRRDLVLLGVYGKLGDELPLDALMVDWMSVGSVVRSWPVSLGMIMDSAAESTLLTGEESTGTDIEGWVVRYESGLRVKIKTLAYIRMHAILTGMNERTVWEVLANGGSLDDLLTNVPDEFMRWVQDVADRLRQAHAEKVLAANMAYMTVLAEAINATSPAGPVPLDDVASDRTSRRQFAEKAIPTGLSSMLFRLYDGKGIEEMAWKMVKPSGTATFSSTEGE